MRDWLVCIVGTGCDLDGKWNCGFQLLGVSCFGQVNGKGGCVVDMNVSIASRVDGDVHDELLSHAERDVVVQILPRWDIFLHRSM